MLSIGGGDPHFMIESGDLPYPLCFDVSGRSGDVFQLLRDPVTGVQLINPFFVHAINHDDDDDDKKNSQNNKININCGQCVEQTLASLYRSWRCASKNADTDLNLYSRLIFFCH